METVSKNVAEEFAKSANEAMAENEKLQAESLAAGQRIIGRLKETSRYSTSGKFIRKAWPSVSVAHIMAGVSDKTVKRPNREQIIAELSALTTCGNDVLVKDVTAIIADAKAISAKPNTTLAAGKTAGAVLDSFLYTVETADNIAESVIK